MLICCSLGGERLAGTMTHSCVTGCPAIPLTHRLKTGFHMLARSYTGAWNYASDGFVIDGEADAACVHSSDLKFDYLHHDP